MNDTSAHDRNRIVVGVDGSAASRAALAWASDEAKLRQATLEILHFWQPPFGSLPPLVADSLPGTSAAYEEEATRIVHDAETSVEARMGDDAPEILTRVAAVEAASALVAASEDQELLVIGRRGRGVFGRLLIGSVADAVVHHASAPVAVIGKPDGHEGGPIVVGVDDSPGARAAFGWAADEALRRDRPLVVVHGWDTPLAVPPGGMAFEPLGVGGHTHDTQQLVDQIVEERRATGAEVPDLDVRAVPSTAPQALIGEATDAALLVVGSRGRGGFAGLLLGSVSQQCLHHAPGSIVVVPAG